MNKNLEVSKWVLNLINHGCFTISEWHDFSSLWQRNLDSEEISELIVRGYLTVERVRKLASFEIQKLKSSELRHLIYEKFLDIDEATEINSSTLIKLKSKGVMELIKIGTLPKDVLIKLPLVKVESFFDEGIIELIAKGFLTFDRALSLDYKQIKNLKFQWIRELIYRGNLNLDIACNLNSKEIGKLESQGIRELIYQGTLDLDTARNLNSTEIRNIESVEIRQLINQGVFSLERARGLTTFQHFLITSPNVFLLINDGRLDIEVALNLTFVQFEHLSSPNIWILFTNNIITLNQILELSYIHYTALNDEQTRARLLNGELNINDIFNPVNVIQDPNNLNDAQSTHNTSVHRTVSESALKLFARYGQHIENQELLDAVLDNVRVFIESLPECILHKDTAFECLARLNDNNHEYIDPVSQLSIRQLLALTYLAINDELRTSTFEDAKSQYLQALYEIERGYNISAAGVDDGLDSRPICLGGTFNKLIEKLQSIHPDCKIEYKTKESASLKFKVVVKEEGYKYIASLAPTTPNEIKKYIEVMENIKEDGTFEPVWEKIRDNVKTRMMEEFGDIYNYEEENPDFINLIDSGIYVEADNLDKYVGLLENSEGYRQYFSETLSRSNRFFSECVFEEIIKSRHTNEETQARYDNLFGLAIYKSE